jgi:predicted MFS family arabinose efflux permease
MADDEPVAAPVRTRRRIGLVALLAADTISALGNMISIVAIPWLVFVTTGDPAKMGLIAAVEMLLYVSAGILATPLADRFGMRRTSIVTDVVSTLAMVAIAAAPGLDFVALVLLVAASGTCRGVGDRAKHVMLRPMAEAAGANIVRVTAGYDGLSRTASLIGAPVGGLLVFWLGAQGAIWFDAVSFAACAVLVLVLVRPPADSGAPPSTAARQPYLAALLAGVRFLVRDRVLLSSHATVLLLNVFAQASIAVFIPLWVADVFGDPPALGVVIGAYAVGAVCGNLVFTVLAPKLPRYQTFMIAVVAGGAPRLLVLGVSQELTVVLTVTFLSGVAVAAVNPILGALCFERVPTELQARVFGLLNATAYIGLPLGALLGGAAAAGLPLSHAILLSGGACLVMSVFALVWFHRTARVTAPLEPAS